MNTRFIQVCLLALALVAGAGAASAAPALLGHAGLQGQTLDAETAKAVLLGKKVTIGNARVVVVIAKSSEAQDAFLQQVTGMNTSQFQNHWRRLFMTGGGSAPKIVENDAEACKVAAETPGAIAIADQASAGGLVVLSSGS